MKIPTFPAYREMIRDDGDKEPPKLLPWIADTAAGISKGRTHLVVSQRHESNSLELFFDLFFVANLSIFTQYHVIIESQGYRDYISFFGLLWGTWFSVTLFDTRFTEDCFFERACKIVQCAVFVVFAFVGSKFEPGGDQHYGYDQSSLTPSNENLQILSYAHATIRALLAIQYLVVLVLYARRGLKEVCLPIALSATCHSVAALSFGLVSLAFRKVDYLPHVHGVLYTTIYAEVACLLIISAVWRNVGFKHTHLAERMGLLTLIILGEGVLGTGKTITIILRTSQPSHYYGLILLILLSIFLIYFIYFDKSPYRTQGTIMQIFWAIAHFPLHLAALGIIEGAQQLVRLHYWNDQVREIGSTIHDACAVRHLSGAELYSSLQEQIKTWKFQDKAMSNQFNVSLNDALDAVSSNTSVCGQVSTGEMLSHPVISVEWVSALPSQISSFYQFTVKALYGSILVDNQLPSAEQSRSATPSRFETVYYYFCGALALFAMTTFVLNLLSRESFRSASSWIGAITRAMTAIAGIAMAVGGRYDTSFLDRAADTAALQIAFAFLFWIFGWEHIGRLVDCIVAARSKKGNDSSPRILEDKGEAGDQSLSEEVVTDHGRLV